MTTFLNSVLDELLRRFGWEGLRDVTLVFPMHRAGVVMRSELQRRMAAGHPSALWAPQMLALGDLFDSLCPLGKEDELFTVCRLHRIYSECVPEDTLEIDRFYGWGRQLLADFTNIDQGIHETETDAFFRNALSLADLDTYKLDEDVRHRLEDLLYKGEARSQSLIAQSVQAHFAALWQAMPDIYHRLRDELLNDGKGYEGQRMRYVVSHWPELRERATAGTYCFIGFNYLLPVERQLMQLLHNEGRALFFWDYIDNFRTNSKAFAFIRQNMLTLPNALPAAVWGQPRRIRAVTATSVHSEAQFAGQWLADTYTHRGEPTAVVICDEAQLEPVIYSLPPIRLSDSNAPEQVNITKGYPLRHAPVFVDTVRMLEKALTIHADNPVEALQSVIRHLDTSLLYTRIQRPMANGQRPTPSPLRGEPEGCPPSWQYHLSREALYQTRRTLVQFITILRDNLLSGLNVHPDLLARLIRRHLEQVSLPFHGEPVTDMQVMGVLETRTLDFKHLLLLNVEEGVIPAHQPDKSFLPYYLRKAYGLQTHDERASVYAYNFFRLLNRAQDVTVLFSQSQTAMTRKTMSRFLMQMLICPEEFTVSRFALTESNTLRPAQTIEIANGQWPKANGQPAHLSPSAINTFYACKRMFYLEYILGLREPDDEQMIFSNRTLGLFVHEAVHYLYERYLGCDNSHPVRINPNRIEQLNTPEYRYQALCAAYERLNAAHSLTPSPLRGEPEGCLVMDQHPMENRVIDTYIRHVLARDRYDAEHRGLTILLLESPQYTRIQWPAGSPQTTCSGVGVANGQRPTANGQPLTPSPLRGEPEGCLIGGRLDRMDRVGGLNGTQEVTRIVDYKCGRYAPAKMSANSADLCTPEKPDTDYIRQTLIYSYVAYCNHPSSIEPHLFFTSQDLTDERTLTRVSIDRTPVCFDADSAGAYTDLIRGMLEDILAEREFPQCTDCSSYCPFLQLCNRRPSKFG